MHTEILSLSSACLQSESTGTFNYYFLTVNQVNSWPDVFLKVKHTHHLLISLFLSLLLQLLTFYLSIASQKCHLDLYFGGFFGRKKTLRLSVGLQKLKLEQRLICSQLLSLPLKDPQTLRSVWLHGFALMSSLWLEWYL